MEININVSNPEEITRINLMACMNSMRSYNKEDMKKGHGSKQEKEEAMAVSNL